MSDKIETNDLRGGLTHRVTNDPYRAKAKEETASLEGGLTFGTSCGPYDGRSEAREVRAAQPVATDFFGDAIPPAQHGARLSTEFTYPPFSVLNARDGWWQERKREWLALGIQSELGRGDMAATGGSPEPLARARAGQQSIMKSPSGANFSRVRMSETIQRLKPTADPAATAARKRKAGKS